MKYSLAHKQKILEVTMDSFDDRYITCLYAPTDNKSLILLGCGDGCMQIRDTQTLSNIYFEHEFPQGDISAFEFHIDTFANLVVLHENGGVSRLILDVDKKTGRMTKMKELQTLRAGAQQDQDFRRMSI